LSSLPVSIEAVSTFPVDRDTHEGFFGKQGNKENARAQKKSRPTEISSKKRQNK
jgi:hypothetical protein